MQIRNPVVAGSFYPFGSDELRKTIKNFFDKAKVEKRKVLGIVSPHAGYVYCGKTAASVYKTISNDFDTAVILGPNHMGMGVGVATSSGIWKTPFGSVKIDEEFTKQLTKGSIVMEDFKAHLREHSIEVQLPWLQYRFNGFKIVPISINPIYFDVKTCKEIGEKIAEVAKSLKRKILIVASSDFTHYGSMYGYKPFSGSPNEVLRKIKEIDMEIVGYIEKIMPQRVIEACDEKRLTVCGYGGIASMLYAAKSLGAKEGKLIDYSTSFDVSRNIDAVVGYCGIVIY